MDLPSFAFVFYARPGVEGACLHAQQEGADVCLLLCALWLERRGSACTAERVQCLRQLARARQLNVIEPLRNLRGQWRQAAGQDPQLAALRAQLKHLELTAEHQLLQQLEAACSEWPVAAQTVSVRWLERLAEPLPTEHKALAVLRLAAAT